MADGIFEYRSWHGPLFAVRVRQCPDPEVARLELEAALERDVTWRPL